MRIALVGPELEENLSLRTIRAALVQAGHEVMQVDFNGPDDLEEAAQELLRSDASIAGLSMVFTARARQFVALAERARSLGFRGHIVAGGHFAAFNAQNLLRDVPAIDSVACGEGESILCDLARTNDPAQVSGLIWRDPTGKVTRNPPALSSDLDRLPWPIRRSPPDAYLGLPVVNMLQSRGCEHACAFCSIAAWHRLRGGPRYRLRNVEAVAAEIAALYGEGVRIFNFHDDNFLLRDRGQRIERVRALRAALRSRQVGRIAFAIKARPDEIDEEILTLLASFGLFRLFLGIEAGTALSLHNLGRGQTMDDNARALDVVNRLGLHACFNLLLLNPDSTLEDLAANVAFLRQRPYNPMNFCRTEIYAGTPLEQRLRRQGRLLGSYFGYDYRIADGRAEAACQMIYRLFHSRNWGERGLHSLVMQVDYENTLLVHFHGKVARAFIPKVKAFIQRVNLNTVAYLDEIVAMAGAEPDEAGRAQFLAHMLPRMQADEAELRVVGKTLLEQIRKRAQRLSQRGQTGKLTVRTLAAAAGLAASVALVGSGCKDKQDVATLAHYSEMIAAPYEPDAGAPPDPKDGSALPDAEPTAQDQALRRRIMQRVLAIAASVMRKAEPLQIELTFDESGKVAQVSVSAKTADTKAIERRLRRLRAGTGRKPSALAGHHLTFSFSKAAVTAARAATRPRHYNEMAPERLPSHYNEQAAFHERDD